MDRNEGYFQKDRALRSKHFKINFIMNAKLQMAISGGKQKKIIYENLA